MAICEKINTAGSNLQSKLNARGVTCIYGKNSDGKQTINDMADMITASNLKGSADSLISITANRPYLLSGETTDLTVRLVNGLGQPLANKSVSISDGSSLYSGITFTLFDVSVTEDTTFTATYSNATGSCLVEFCDFVDYAVTGKKNTNWTNYSSRLTVTTDESGTTVSKGSSNGFYYVNNGSQSYTDYTVEFDIISCANVFWYANGTSTQNLINLGTYFGSGGHCKIVSEEGVAKAYKDGTQVGNDITITATAPYGLGFRINAGDGTRNIKYKNFRLQEL